MQNAKKNKTATRTALTTSITLILSVCIIVSLSHDGSARAEHGTLTTFQTGGLQYRCSLSILDYDGIIPCEEFSKAAATWSNSISGLDITNVSSGGSIVALAGKTTKDDAVAIMRPFFFDGTLQNSTIHFSTDYKWGDGTNWLHIFSRYDLRSIALHELGHALGLDHDSNSSLMKPGIPIWEVQRTIPTHDKSAVQEKFDDD